MTVYLWDNTFAVLEPKGIVAEQQRDLFMLALGLCLVVILPVFALTGFISYRYRESNKKAKYSPDFDHHLGYEALWWGIPMAIIGVLSVITWNTSHSLDPHKPLNVAGKPLNVQVVALDWKWLFIYPEQGVASVNFTQFPVNRPVDFHITADAPMNSFWIPQLAGQIYAMPGMKTQLHIMANETGEYAGSSSNLSGEGFAGMRFTAKASSASEFNSWVDSVKKAGGELNEDAYMQLAEPSKNNPVKTFAAADSDLFDWIVEGYSTPVHEACKEVICEQ
jgi:cytochrome o ubiquinol oxidase subunit II